MSQISLDSGQLAIDLHYVDKKYGRKVHALRGIQMKVRPGEIFGLLGPNGAGKSTLVKILMTVIRANRAEGAVLGNPIGHKPTLARVGYMPENVLFPSYLTGREVLLYYAAMSRVDRSTRRRRADELLEKVGLTHKARFKVRTYSKGMQQRLGLAQALMNDPQLIVLDEPTDGLDPLGRREIRDLLKTLRDQGRTVFLNSHLLGEVESVCDRVAILAEGKVVRQGTVEELTSLGRYYEIQLHAPVTPALHEAICAALGCEPYARPAATAAPLEAHAPIAAPVVTGCLATGESLEVIGNAVRIGTDRPEGIQGAIDALRRRELVIDSVRMVRQSLEDYFISVVSDSSAPGGAGVSPVELAAETTALPAAGIRS
jgi:ABC-2 type transport system ATP-binding protein